MNFNLINQNILASPPLSRFLSLWHTHSHTLSLPSLSLSLSLTLSLSLSLSSFLLLTYSTVYKSLYGILIITRQFYFYFFRISGIYFSNESSHPIMVKSLLFLLLKQLILQTASLIIVYTRITSAAFPS